MKIFSGLPRLAAMIATTLAAAIVNLPAGAQAQSSAAEHKLAIQIYPGIFLNLLPWVAQAKGFYEKNGVTVTMVPLDNGPLGLAALQGGSIQLAQNNTDVMLLANAKGLDLQMVVGNWGQQFSFVARDGFPLPHLSDGYPKVMQDLVGHKVGVAARGSGTEYAMRATLSEAGDSPDSVSYVAVGGTTGQIPALRSGQVDVVVEPIEAGAMLQAMGVGKVMLDFQKGQGPKSFQNLSDCYAGFFGKRTWISQNGETVRRFVAAEQDANNWAHDPANLDELVHIALANAPKPGVADPVAMATAYLKTAPFQTKYVASCVANWNSLLVSTKLADKPLPIDNIIWTPPAK